jgi:DNA repair exonuclease SbcCD ATPase subunit
MITSASIQNAQSHKDTFIEFDSGVNVFVGDTDSGKSAIMRSLRYAIWNRPNSKSLVSNWGGVLKVELNIDGNFIVRKSDNKEVYLLNDLEFNSFGTKTPVEIERIINMEEINNQEQIDNFFLLTETPGYVASYLNKIANLEQIDSTTKSIKSELNETNRLIEHQKEDLKKKEAELESFSFLAEFKKDLDEADAFQVRVKDTTILIDVLSYHIKEIKKCNEQIEEANEMLSIKPEVNSALSLFKQSNELEIKIKKIQWYITCISDFDKEIEELTKLLDLKLLVAETFELKKQQSDKEAKLDSLNSISSKISTIDNKIEISQVEITTNKDIYETELHKLGKCFFCGQKLK